MLSLIYHISYLYIQEVTRAWYDKTIQGATSYQFQEQRIPKAMRGDPVLEVFPLYGSTLKNLKISYSGQRELEA